MTLMIIEINTALAAATHATRIVKDLLQLSQNAEVNQAVINLQSSMLDLQSKLFEFQARHSELIESNRALEQELATVRAKEEIGKNLVRRNNEYFKFGDSTKAGPYCMVCWDADGLLVNLTVYEAGGSICGRCAKH